MIDASSLEAQFSLTRRDFILDIDVRLPATGITGIFGPSGSGKSTLLRCIAGLERNATGRIHLDGVCFQNEAHFMPPHRRGVALIDQGIHLFTHMDVRRNLLYGLRRAPIERRRVKLEEVVESLDLEPLLSRNVTTLSGGEARRVAIGRALLASPNLLLLDEPCAGLDAQRKREVLPFLRRVESEFAIPMIYVTHDLSELVYLCTVMATMEKGRIKTPGAPAIIQTTLDPDAHTTALGATIPANITKFDTDRHAATLDLGAGHTVTMASTERANGASVHLQILARDVDIHIKGNGDSSALAVLDGKIAAISRRTMTHITVALSTKSGYLLALLDRLTADRLELKLGMCARASIRHANILS